MNIRPPQAFNIDSWRANYPGVRWNLNLNQNLNREPWSATSDILNSVEWYVNPVFRAFKDRLCKPVPCPKVQGGRLASAQIPISN